MTPLLVDAVSPNVLLSRTYLNPSGANANRGFQTPDAADVGFLTGIDIRCLVEPATWTPSALQFLVAKYGSAGGTRSWSLGILNTGRLQFTYSVNGSTGVGIISTAGPSGTGPLWVRCVVDPTTGGVVTATFYTSRDGVTWTQLGTPVTNAAVGPWFDGTAPVEAGQAFAQNAPYTGKLYEVQLRNLAGTLVAGLIPPAIGNYTDTGGHVWTRGDSAAVVTTQTITPDKIAGGTTGQRLTPTVPSAGVPIWTNPPMYNVRDYGALGDGVTNDSAAIQATIDAVEAQTYGCIVFPPGQYKLVTGLVHSATAAAKYVEFLGLGPAGMGAPLSSASVSLLIPVGVTGLACGPSTTGYYTGSPVIRGINFRGPGSTSDASTLGLTINNVSGAIIENCCFSNFTDITNQGTSPTRTGSGTGARCMANISECAYTMFRGCKFEMCFVGLESQAGYTFADHCIFDGNHNLVGGNYPASDSIGLLNVTHVTDCGIQAFGTLMKMSVAGNGITWQRNRLESFYAAHEFAAFANSWFARVEPASVFSGVTGHVALRIGAGGTDVYADFRGRNVGFSRYDNQGTANQIHFDATSIPTSGTHGTGEYAWLKAPVAGGTQGWVCTAAGTPGTWKTFGAIAA